MPKSVVIIGGGVSSKHAAELLVKIKDVQVTMIQGTKFVEWPLAIPVVLCKPEMHDKAISPNPSSFQVPKVQYKYGVATEVDASAKTVKLRDGSAVPYDTLVVATGFALPLIYPKPGASLQERKDEVAGDVRTAYPGKRVVLLCRDQLLKDFPAATREKAKAVCGEKKIELFFGVSKDAPSSVRLEPGVLNVEENVVSYDVFLPMYSQGPNTGFLAGVPNMLDDRGNIVVNKHLQSEVCPEIFALGVGNIDEGFVGMAKLDGQWKTITANIKAQLQGKALVPHKEGSPFMKKPPIIFIGHGKGGWAALDFAQLPPPLKCCCCCGLGGFPCCPPPCCYPLCGVCPCGYCCSKPEGERSAKSLGPIAFKSMGFHFRGAGEAKAPEQQSMVTE